MMSTCTKAEVAIFQKGLAEHSAGQRAKPHSCADAAYLESLRSCVTPSKNRSCTSPSFADETDIMRPKHPTALVHRQDRNVLHCNQDCFRGHILVIEYVSSRCQHRAEGDACGGASHQQYYRSDSIETPWQQLYNLPRFSTCAQPLATMKVSC